MRPAHVARRLALAGPVVLVAAALVPATASAKRYCCFEFTAYVEAAQTVDFGEDGPNPTYPANYRFKTYRQERAFLVRSVLRFRSSGSKLYLEELAGQTYRSIREVSDLRALTYPENAGHPGNTEFTQPVPCERATNRMDAPDFPGGFSFEPPASDEPGTGSVRVSGGRLRLGDGRGPAGFRARCPQDGTHGFDSYLFTTRPLSKTFIRHASQGDRCSRSAKSNVELGPHNGGVPSLTHTFHGTGSAKIEMSYFKKSKLSQRKRDVVDADKTDGWGGHGTGKRSC